MRVTRSSSRLSLLEETVATVLIRFPVCYVAFLQKHYPSRINEFSLFNNPWTATFTTAGKINYFKDCITILMENCKLLVFIGLTHRPRKILLFINPFGGKKRGLKIWEKDVQPLMTIAGIDAKTLVTERVGHIRDVLLSADLTDFHVSFIFHFVLKAFTVTKHPMQNFLSFYRLRIFRTPFDQISCFSFQCI